MDTALSLLYNALIAGAAAALKPTAEKVVTDSYEGLKALLRRKLGSKVRLEDLDRTPTATQVRATLQQDLEANAAATVDGEVLRQAQELLKVVAAHDAMAAEDAGISITALKAGAEIDIEGLVAHGAGVKVAELEAGGSIRIKGVQSGNPRGR